MKIDCLQGSSDWLAHRSGRVTASRLKDALAVLKRKEGESAARWNYKVELLAERITGKSAQHFVTGAMQEGTEKEPLARELYAITQGVTVEEVGFFVHECIPEFGASPDGLVGSDGMIEIKCPQLTTHIGWMLDGIVPEEHKLQMLGGMLCSGRKWCDFVSFHEWMPAEEQLFIRRLSADDAQFSEIERGVELFLVGLHGLLRQLGHPITLPVKAEPPESSLDQLAEQDMRDLEATWGSAKLGLSHQER